MSVGCASSAGPQPRQPRRSRAAAAQGAAAQGAALRRCRAAPLVGCPPCHTVAAGRAAARPRSARRSALAAVAGAPRRRQSSPLLDGPPSSRWQRPLPVQCRQPLAERARRVALPPLSTFVAGASRRRHFSSPLLDRPSSSHQRRAHSAVPTLVKNHSVHSARTHCSYAREDPQRTQRAPPPFLCSGATRPTHTAHLLFLRSVRTAQRTQRATAVPALVQSTAYTARTRPGHTRVVIVVVLPGCSPPATGEPPQGRPVRSHHRAAHPPWSSLRLPRPRLHAANMQRQRHYQPTTLQHAGWVQPPLRRAIVPQLLSLRWPSSRHQQRTVPATLAATAASHRRPRLRQPVTAPRTLHVASAPGAPTILRPPRMRADAFH